MDLGPMAAQTKKEPGVLTEKLNAPCYCVFFAQVQDTTAFLIIIKVIYRHSQNNKNNLGFMKTLKFVTLSQFNRLTYSFLGNTI